MLVVVAHHTRTGVAALNVVTAALRTDARTRDVDVRFAKGRHATATEIARAASAGDRVVALWSSYSADFPDLARDLAWVKERTRGLDALHVVGGVHASAEPRQVLRAGFDLAALGEGEVTAIELCAALVEGRDPAPLRGLASLDERGELVSHGPAERRPLDDFPAFNLPARKFNPIEITRGCVYACTFCQTPFLFKARFRHRSVANVAEHVRALRSAGLHYVRFVTPTALSYGSHDEQVRLDAIEALLAGVREAFGDRGKIFFGTFPSEVRPEHVSPEALAMLRRWVDNRAIVLGGQSGSQRVLDATRRGHSVEDVERAVRLCVESGFTPHVDLLLGIPGETPEERATTVRFAERLVSLGARIHGHGFMPLPGTPLRDSTPERIESPITLALSHLESNGALWGQWRHQLIAGEQLARRRDRDPR